MTSAVLRRLETIGQGRDFLEDSLSEISRVHNELLVQEPSVRDWPGLSGEFAALFSWLMQDMKTSVSSIEFDKVVLRETLQSLHQLGIEGPYPPELKLKIHHWVLGACWSRTPGHSAAIVFPLRTLSLDKEQAGIAYNGLIRHLQTQETLNFGEEARADTEMSASSVAIRVVGLAEALNPEMREKAKDAISNQLGAKFGASGIKTGIKKEVEKVWHTNAIDELVAARHAIAHVSTDNQGTFSQAVNSLSGSRINVISELASTLMAAEILHKLTDVSEVKVTQWLNQFRNQLENQNLNSLQPSMPSQFLAFPGESIAGRFVTPLG